MGKNKDKHKKKAIKKNLKEKKDKEKGKGILGFYCVAAIDILGQKEKLRKFHNFPETDEEKEEFQNMIEETYGVVDRLRTSFKDHYAAFNDDKRLISVDVSEDKKRAIRKLRKYDIKFQGFSDSTFSSVPLQHNSVAINGVYAVLMSAASVFTTHLVNGLPLRGGIEVGMAADTRDGDIYGTALNDAHHLESRVAKQPRILIGDELVAYINLMKNLEGDDDEARYVRGMAEACESIIGRDIDGNIIIDYMGEGMVKVMEDDEALRAQYLEFLPRIKRFFEEQKQKWESEEEKSISEEEKKKLSKRYQRAIEYYDSRIHLWD